MFTAGKKTAAVLMSPKLEIFLLRFSAVHDISRTFVFLTP